MGNSNEQYEQCIQQKHEHKYNYHPIQIQVQPTTPCGHLIVPAKYMQHRFNVYHHPKKPIWMEYNQDLAAIGAFGLRPRDNELDKLGQFCVAATRKIDWLMAFGVDSPARTYAIQSEFLFNRSEFLRILAEVYDRIEKGLPLKQQHLLAIQFAPCHRLYEIAFNLDLPAVGYRSRINQCEREHAAHDLKRKLTLKLRKAILKLKEKYGLDAIGVLSRAISLVEKRFDYEITEEMIRGTGLFKYDNHNKDNDT